MGLIGETRWKEEFIITDETERSFCFDCGWGADPPVAYVPALKDWNRCVPAWLRERRDEVIKIMKAQHHVVHDGPYPDCIK